MKVLLIIFGIMSTIIFLFGNIKINGGTNINILERLIASVVFGFAIAIIIGLPILGIISLF